MLPFWGLHRGSDDVEIYGSSASARAHVRLDTRIGDPCFNGYKAALPLTMPMDLRRR
jgi:hypothetical protein